MSTIYENSFWKGYDIIHEHYMKRKNQCIQLNYIFSRLSVLYENFGEGLTELVDDINFYESINKKDTSTFDNFMEQFIKQLKDLGSTYTEVSKKIKETFVENILGLEPTEIYFTDNLNEMEPNQEIIDKEITFADIEADFISELNTLEEKKTNFKNAINQQIRAQVGMGKFKSMFNFKNKSNFSPDDKTNQYMEKVKEVEQKRRNYVHYYKTLTNYYYNTEVKFIDQTKFIMKKYTEEILSPLNKKLGSIIEDQSFIDNIDSEKDTKTFVKENKTIGFPPFQLDLLTNIVEANMIINDLGLKESEKQEKINIINEFEENVRYYVSQLNENRNQLEPYFTKLNEGQFTDELLEKLKLEFSKEDSGQENEKEKEEGKSHKKKVHNYGAGLYENMGIKNIITFLSLYNTQRFSNNGLVLESSFNYLVTIFNYIISKADKINDFELKNKILEWCITLSLTFKCIINGKEKYLQEGIENNEVFKKADIWKSLIDYSIAENANQSNNYSNFKTEDKIILQNIAVTKLLSILHNMNSFNVPKETIDVIVKKLVDTYGLDIAQVNEFRKAQEVLKDNKEEPKMIE